MYAYFCQLHACIIRTGDYHQHMAQSHEGRNDCIGGITNLAQVEAILGGATYAQACCQRRTMHELADQAAADTKGESRLRFTVRFRDLYEQEHGDRLSPKTIIDGLRDISVDVIGTKERWTDSPTWTCNTTGVACQYDNLVDPGHDQCVNCGQPQDRK